MKNTIIFFIILTFISCKSQEINVSTFENIKPHLVDFLLLKKQITPERAEKLKSGEHTFNLRGAINNLSSGVLKDGLYAFSSFGSHSMAYFVLVEGKKFIILDISTRKGLDEAIKSTLDFTERNRYCVDITNEYVSRLIRVYYNINKDPLNGSDVNCEKGINDFKSLP